MTIDAKGRHVLTFMGKVENLGRIGDLTKALVEMAESGDWRDYTTALGREQWRACEFDYFLIATGVAHEDARRVIQWNQSGETLAPLMDASVDGRKRRPIEKAAESYRSPGPETFVARARRLGWLDDGGDIRPAVSERARRSARVGMKHEERARHNRSERISAERRSDLDRLAEATLAELRSNHERGYLVDRLRRAKMDWRADAEELDWKTSALAERWGISRSQAYKRIAKLREA